MAATYMAQFTVIQMESTYNGIIGRPLILNFQAILSPYHQMIKFPTAEGLGIWRSNQAISRSCYLIATKEKLELESYPIKLLDAREDLSGSRPSPVKDVRHVSIDESRTLHIGSLLGSKVKGQLVDFINVNSDVFAWSAGDMTGIDPGVTMHKLQVSPSAKPAKQKKMNIGGDKQNVASEEMGKLLQAGFIRKVDYPDWLANVVVVKKSNGK